jgi:hypothetical protein
MGRRSGKLVLIARLRVATSVGAFDLVGRNGQSRREIFTVLQADIAHEAVGLGKEAGHFLCDRVEIVP